MFYMFRLQAFTMPKAEICIDNDMYFRLSDDDKVYYNFELGEYKFQTGGVLQGNTYFNSFSSSNWLKYTVINEIQIQLILKGSFEVSLVKEFLVEGTPLKKTVKKLYANSSEKTSFTFDYSYLLDQFEGIYFIELKALTNDSYFYGGGLFTTKAPENNIRIGAIFCTFKREKFIAKNLLLFKQEFFFNTDSQVKNFLELYVIDNAQTLDPDLFDCHHLHLIKNKNVGGAGGFTRGMIEVLKSKQNFSHILLMDDDALTDTNSIEKTYSFLSFLKREHMDVFVGGSTLRLDKQTIQLESGAVWNNNLLYNIKQNLDLTSEKDILFNELEESRSYNAWVFACFPMCKIDEKNLPLPLFVRGDDMEYGMRNANKIVTMNGICAWHMPLHNTYSAFMTYYVLRNQLVLNALYDKDFSSKAAVKLLKNSIKHELLLFRYDNVKLVFKAFKDFLLGVPFFLETDGESLHKVIMKSVPQMLDFNELSRTPYPFIYAKLEVSKNQRTPQKWKNILRLITLNGYLLPSFLYKKQPQDNYGIVELAAARPINFFRRKRVLQVDLIKNKGYLTELNRSELIKASIEFVKLSLKIRTGAYQKAVESYQLHVNELRTISFWKNYLNI